jgi:hypothetical protein
VSAGHQFVHALKMPRYLSINGVPSGAVPSGVQAFTPADPKFGFALLATRQVTRCIADPNSQSMNNPTGKTVLSLILNRHRSHVIFKTLEANCEKSL